MLKDIQLNQSLLSSSLLLPEKPGCYLMKADDQFIYIGKAKNLKSRVSSYFQKGRKLQKTEFLVSHITSFEFILAGSEAEALILENNLIKKHKPKYNIRLKDDRSYPYILINEDHDFPRLEYKRNFLRNSSSTIYGPFVHGSNIFEITRIISKSFLLRECSDAEFLRRKTPCLLYQLGQCSASCVEKISKENYLIDLSLVKHFFEGKPEEMLENLESQMMKAADNELFEKAALIRDHLKILKSFLDYSHHKNVEFDSRIKNIDFISYYIGEFEIDYSIYVFRNGALMGHKNFHFLKSDQESQIDDFQRFIIQYYLQSNDSYPNVITTPFGKNINKLLEDSLYLITKSKIQVRASVKGFEGVIRLNLENAKEHHFYRLTNEDSVFMGLNKLKDLLKLKECPSLLECYDIAVLQGSSPTASQIVYRDGVADKSSYRYYHLSERVEGNNDYAMLEEFLERRLKHGKFPDVIIVDGGVGQVNTLMKILKNNGFEVPVVGIAKSRIKSSFREDKISRSSERLIIPGRLNPYILKNNRSLYKIITQMRDEAHRFSRKLHHHAEKKRLLISEFDQIDGIGPKTRNTILSNLDRPMKELKYLSSEELKNLLNISLNVAMKIKKFLEEN